MANSIISQITTTTLNKANAASDVAKASPSPASEAEAGQEAGSIRQNSAVEQSTALNSSFVEKGQLEDAVSDINSYVQTVNRELQFRVDDALPLGRAVVTVVDADTQEKIREFPSEQALSLARSLKEQQGETSKAQIEGLIISAQA